MLHLITRLTIRRGSTDNRTVINRGKILRFNLVIIDLFDKLTWFKSICSSTILDVFDEMRASALGVMYKLQDNVVYLQQKNISLTPSFNNLLSW